MSTHVFSAGYEHGRSTTDVETIVTISDSFWKAWKWSGNPGKLVAEVVAFMCRAGGPPRGGSGLLQVFLKTDPRLKRRPFRGEHYRGQAVVWVSPHEGNAGWGVPMHYAKKPLLPAYAVRDVREAVVAGVAHETCHWLGIGRHPSKYWQSEQALDGTEFVCEMMAAAALEVFCRRNPRFRTL